VDIYVISTGIEYKNKEFGGRAFYGGYDKHGYDGSDYDGQGTAVASLHGSWKNCWSSKNS